MKKIHLTQGKTTLVDDEDYDLLIKYKWCAHKQKTGVFYAHTNIRQNDGSYKTESMHRILMEPEEGEDVDHVDCNGLNNQKHNLRVCTHAENCRNSARRKKNRSGYKGVDFNNNKWRVRLKVDGRTVVNRRFSDISDAIREYKRCSEKYHGDFGRTA